MTHFLQSGDIRQEEYWSLLEMATDGVWRWDIREDRVRWSPGIFETLRYPEGERTVADIVEIAHPDDREEYRKAIEDHLREGGAYRVKLRMRTYDGEYLWIEAWGMRVTDEKGEPVAMMGFLTNVSEREAQHQSLKAAEARFRAFMDNAPAAVFMKDREGVHIYANRSAAELAGTTVDRMLGRRNEDIFPPETAWELTAIDRGVLEDHRLTTWTGRLEREDGSERWVHDVKFPVQLDTGEWALGGFGLDVTALQQARDEVETARRLDSLGRLAGGVAHDFNNMLNVILGYSQLALAELDDPHPVRSLIEPVIEAGQRSSALTRQLLAFGRRQAIQPARIDLNEALKESLGILRRLIREDVELVPVYAPESVQIRIDPGQFSQLLTNLCVNARDAIPGRGTIHIEVSAVTLDADAPQLEGPDSPEPGEFAVLQVRDTGEGMDAATMDRLFEPFFTTKLDGSGTGLGLATVYGIVRQNDGLVTVDSVPGDGSTFRILLPRLGDEAAPSAPGEVEEILPDGSPGEGGTLVLLAEDEPSLLELGRRMLARLGCTVVSANSPDGLLRAMDGLAGTPRILLTDVVMPGLPVEEMVARVRARYPGIEVIYTSGHPSDRIAARGVIDEDVLFLPKPFGMADLSRVLERALGRSDDAPAP